MPPTLKPTWRETTESSTITSSSTIATAPSAAVVSYSRSRARPSGPRDDVAAIARALELLVGVDDGLAFGAGLLEPFLQHRVADLGHVALQLRRRRQDVHAVLLQQVEVLAILLLRERPAAR